MQIKMTLSKIEHDTWGQTPFMELTYTGKSNTFYSHYLALKLTPAEAEGFKIGETFTLEGNGKELTLSGGPMAETVERVVP